MKSYSTLLHTNYQSTWQRKFSGEPSCILTRTRRKPARRGSSTSGRPRWKSPQTPPWCAWKKLAEKREWMSARLTSEGHCQVSIRSLDLYYTVLIWHTHVMLIVLIRVACISTWGIARRRGHCTYDVRTGRGRGVPKSRRKEQNQLISVHDGEGVKKFCGCHMCMPPSA